MFNDTIFDTWLDQKANEIVTAMGNGSALTSEQMMVLVLKAQTNHFNHLDIDLRNDMKDMREDMDKRFALVDKRFEQFDKRFEQVDKRFETMIGRMDSMMIWSFATTLTVGGIVIAAIKFL